MLKDAVYPDAVGFDAFGLQVIVIPIPSLQIAFLTWADNRGCLLYTSDAADE